MTGVRGFGFSIILAAAALAAAGWRIPAPVVAAADPQSLIAQGQELLRQGGLESLKALGAEPATLAWLDSQRRRGKWKLSLLPLPGKPEAEALAVFHDFHTCESISDHIHRIVRTPAGWRFGPEIPETDTRGFRVRDHAIKVTYDLPKNACAINDEVEIERLGSERIGLLRLSADMIVDSVRRDGKPFPAASVPGVIAFQAPADKKFKLQIAYHGIVNHPDSDYILPSETVLVSYWYPHIARLPATLGVAVTVPKGWTAAGQGEMISREDTGAETRFRFRNEIPTCYFSLDAAPYHITTREVNGRRLSVYEVKSVAGRADKALDELARSLEFFEKSFGKYPYSHYEIVETAQPFGGALEAYSFATFQSGTIPGAIAHEVAHTWWGGIVPNPYTRTMWNESFASYSDGLFRRKTGSRDRAINAPPGTTLAGSGPRALQGMHNDANRGRGMLQSYRVPIDQATDTTNGGHGAVGYGKGSLVLAMLEDLLGTERMIRCMRRFVSDHRPGEAADWSDFERAVKKETGEDFGWFFEQWLTRGGVPLVSLRNVAVSRAGGSYSVRGRIIQEGPAYRLRIPVLLETAAGPEWREVAASGPSTEFTLASPAPVAAVKLDPAGNVLMAGSEFPQGASDPFTVVLPAP